MSRAAPVDVTVLTPSFGYGRFIEDGVLSVTGQEGLRVQHVVQDGGSTDETVDVLRKHDDEVEWWSEPDRGQSDALNKGLEKASGRWIAWLNADEFYLPGGLAALVREGDRTGADLVYGEVVYVDVEGRLTRLVSKHDFSAFVLRSYGCYIPSVSTIFRRSSLPPEPWDASLRMNMDWDLYLRLNSTNARFEFVKYAVGAFRLHPEQLTAAPFSQFADVYETLHARHHIDTSNNRKGRWLHRAMKVQSAGYVRELRTMRFRSADMRWFRSERARRDVDSFLRTNYRSRYRPTSPAAGAPGPR
ncbi:MAG TPA: glycosyltransferase family 2 protein [Actinomycetota bacterium]|jgi:glycosyltransferase involved in cell wall biosynthesis